MKGSRPTRDGGAGDPVLMRSPKALRDAPASDSALLTANEVAELLAVSRAWVYEQSRCGRIPTVTLGRYRRYRLAAIEEWVAGLERGGNREAPFASHRA